MEGLQGREHFPEKATLVRICFSKCTYPVICNQQPAGSAARRAMRPHRERRPADGRERGHPPGSAQRRGQRRPPWPLGPVVKQNTREFLFNFYSSKMINGYCDTDKNFRENQQKVNQTETTVLTRKLKIPTCMSNLNHLVNNFFNLLSTVFIANISPV